MVLQEASKVDRLASELGASWPNLVDARRATRVLHEKIASVALKSPPDCSMVVFGSLAREEATTESDVDWTLLVDGQAYPSHLTSALDIENRLLNSKLKEPGKEGTFGGLSFSHDLIHYIGGESDSNSNTTRRLLLLLESSAINAAEVHTRVITQILKRYIEEDFGFAQNTTQGIPRFLLNDISRYWRTIAVDFAYKRRERQAKGWALRTVKLRLSRKLIYAAGLLACYSCRRTSTLGEADATERTLATVAHLEEFLRQSPLDILADAILPHLALRGFESAARDLFESYDAFIGLLNNSTERGALDALKQEDAADDPRFERARQLGKRFQRGLDTVFLEPNETPLYSLTRTYGVF